jgi:hypothetical protein
MKNKGITELKEALGYGITEAGDVVNIKSGKVVATTNGSVRLTVGKKRITFKLIDLQSLYALKEVAAKIVSEPKKEVVEAVKEPKPKSEKVPKVKVHSRKVSEEDKDLELKTVKEAGLTSGAALIRSEFAKNNKEFDVEEFSIKTGIRMTRVKDGIRLCLLKLKKDNK